jgi:SET domain-containing protein
VITSKSSFTPSLRHSAPRLRHPAPLHFLPSPIHGLGAFATTSIPKATRILEYLGERISKAESLGRCRLGNPYIFALSDHEDLDGNVPENPARLLNHSCAANCDAIRENGHLWIVTNRDIACDEEVTFNYNFDLVDYQDHPCHCGTPLCVGYIVAEEFFNHLRSR